MKVVPDRIDRGLAEKYEPALRLGLAGEAHVHAHHARHLGIAAERRQFDHDEILAGRVVKLGPEADIHGVVDNPGEDDGRILEGNGGEQGGGHHGPTVGWSGYATGKPRRSRRTHGARGSVMW
jgi:hypothetical protein